MFVLVITRSGVWTSGGRCQFLVQLWISFSGSSSGVFAGSTAIYSIMCKLASFWSWKPNWIPVAVLLSMARVLQGTYPLRALQKKMQSLTLLRKNML